MAAFRAALAARAGIECDIRMVGDTIAIVFHDSNLRRLCGADRETLSLCSQETLNYRLLGTNEHIPCLYDVLQLVGGQVPLLLEIKSDKRVWKRLCQSVADCLESCQERIGVMSFDPRVGRWFALNFPTVRRGIVVGTKESRVRRWAKLYISRAQFAAVETPLLGTRWAQRLRRRMPLYCWTVRTVAERAQAAVQADSLIWEGDGRPRN